MKTRSGKKALKNILGEMPLAPELYWRLRQQGKPLSRSFSLQRVQKGMPEWIAQAEAARTSKNVSNGKKIFMFSTLRYWVEHSTLLSLALAGLGHEVTLAYLPLNNWRVPMNRFDLRRQNAYTKRVLKPIEKLVQTVSFLDIKPLQKDFEALAFENVPSNTGEDGKDRALLPGSPDPQQLKPSLAKAIQGVSERDVQYTLQVEEVDTNNSLYRLRLERNTQAALAVLNWFTKSAAQRPDLVLMPNGSILEMGTIYQVARALDIPVVTYEFGEQRGRIWLAQNDEVMLQHTDELWSAWKEKPLSTAEREQMHALYTSRQNASLWENFSRLWQGLPSQGGDQARQALGLDSRPVSLLAANVIGDSLTLGRQVFSRNMTEWLQRTLRNFSQRPDNQLVVRIHPGERYAKGPSVADVIHEVMPELPENIRLVAADDPVNTYDLIDVADLGLVYTTTVGMEMAMSGVPTVVAGQTHYRGKGFTYDPADWEDYFDLLNHLLQDPKKSRLQREQVERAWQYAYRFFFNYPLPFPWHMLYYSEELEQWPVEKVLSETGQGIYGEAFRALADEPRHWSIEEGQDSDLARNVL
jgi:Capsule polysaccharide biosynthesis protein